ncbi:MAG: lantibiotic dehydratase family protein, partial [Holophagales bacterium]|nr:lantibiotic dehydratase family protein [Holophagales bacterium]
MSELGRLRATGSLTAFRRALAAAARADALGPSLEEALFAAVGGEEDRLLRRALLSLKRDVHNRRALRRGDLEKVGSAGLGELADALGQYQELRVSAGAARGEALRRYEDELPEIRRRFRESVGDADFGKALLLSSPTLFDGLGRYRRASLETPDSKLRQIERSLMRYLSRMVMKASPFSRFCALLPGELEPGAEGVLEGSPRSKRGHLRLDKSLFNRLLPILLGSPGIRRHLSVELNPTLRLEGGRHGGEERWCFLSSRGSREVFQRLGNHPVVALVVARLEGAERPTWQELVDGLLHHPELDAEAEEAGAYVDRLLEIGLLRFRLGIPEQEVNWDEPLAELLGPIDDPVAARIVRFLGDLRRSVGVYGDAPVEERPSRLEASIRVVAELLAELRPDEPAFANPPFYEDAAGEARLELDLGPIEDCLLEYVELTSRMAFPRSEQASMRHFFDTFYGEPEAGGERSVSLLRFYEDYHREHFKGHLERQRGNASGPARDPGDGPGGGTRDGTEPEPYDA